MNSPISSIVTPNFIISGIEPLRFLCRSVNILAPAVAPPNICAKLALPSPNAPANTSKLKPVCVAFCCTSNNDPPKSIPVLDSCLKVSICASTIFRNICPTEPIAPPTIGIVLNNPVMC